MVRAVLTRTPLTKTRATETVAAGVAFDDGWLRGLGPDGLAALLDRRPEAVVPPDPLGLTDLAERLAEPSAVIAALTRLDRPTLQVAEVITALGGTGVSRAAVQRLLGVPGAGSRRDVEAAVDTLSACGLLREADGLFLADSVRIAFDPPLGLGPAAADLLRGRTADDLRVMARNLGVTSTGRKDVILGAVLAGLRDADHVRAVVNAAPEPARQVLVAAATTGEMPPPDYGYYSVRYSQPTRPMHWAMSRGLMFLLSEWDATSLVVPAEVALALRGPGYTAPFDPVPPAVARIPVDGAAVAADAVAAGASLLRVVTALLEDLGRHAMPVLRSGGVGVREIRRLAKALGCSTGEIRLGLAVAHQAQLLGLAADTAAPTGEYDSWRDAEPARRLARLLAAWWSLPHASLAKSDAAWVPSHPADGAARLRAAMLSEAAGEPAAGVSDPSALAELVIWRRPQAYLGPDPHTRAVASWQEAILLGAVGRGAVSPAGHALLAGDGAALEAALTAIGASTGTARIQADLTAVVPGTPSARLRELLDAVADRETLGVASTWRFSPASVRRALDAGHTADELLAALTEVAADDLPQPLGYLVRDVARRHGQVRARAVACCLRCDDTALLAEITAARRLRAAGLSVVAPTVLAGTKPLDETLAALRDAGYAPVAEAADGTPLVEVAAIRRMAPTGGPQGLHPAPHPIRTSPILPAKPAVPDSRAVARQLLEQTDRARSVSSFTYQLVRSAAAHLTSAQARMLAHAIDHGTPVTIDYLAKDGGFSRRVISEAILCGQTLTAWCQLRDDERNFALARIRAVSSAAQQ